MGDSTRARQLIAQGQYKEAKELIEDLLRENDDDELYYLRGIISLKMKNYESAQSYFTRAMIIDNKALYHRTSAMAYFEIFDIHSAIEAFRRSLQLDSQDHTANFFLALSYMLVDEPTSSEYLKRAYAINPKKTQQLLFRFYELFVKKDPAVSDAQKKKIMQSIEKNFIISK
ncbi:tetratricopeptide repeat protein [Candidatus Micrarchaeota archaeon]|nr:tetratricopeptide repeat protein [Candidatus Micrarchaeota archaeon]